MEIIKQENDTQWYQDKEKLDIIKKVVLNGNTFTDLEFSYVIEFAKKYNLDPFMKQISAWKDKHNKVVTFVTHTGLFKIAFASGLFDGISEVIYGKDEKGEFGRVEVFRKGCLKPFVSKLYRREFMLDKFIWKEKPEFMFSKCVEAAALRKAFPDVLSGVYIEEENWIEPEYNIEQKKENSIKEILKELTIADIQKEIGFNNSHRNHMNQYDLKGSDVRKIFNELYHLMISKKTKWDEVQLKDEIDIWLEKNKIAKKEVKEEPKKEIKPIQEDLI